MRFIILALAISCVSVTVGCGHAAGQTAAPPWLGKELRPSPADLSGVYDCGEQSAALRLTSPGAFGAPRVERWSFAGDYADAGDLARWNGWLEELAGSTSQSVSCGDDYAAVFVTGLKRGNGESYSVNVFWADGELWRIPGSADEYRRAEQEGWFPQGN